jgi:flagellar biosynthetic protein FliR
VTGGAPTLLADLPGWAFAAMLLLSRIGTACMLLPGIGEAELPMMVRMAVVVALTALLLPVVMPLMPPVPPDVPHLAAMLLAEIATGLWLGWLARLVLLAMPMAGQLIAAATGMTNVLQPDAMLGANAAALSRLMGLAAPVLVMAVGLHALPLAAIMGSYRLVAPGHLLPVGDGVSVYVGAVSQAFALALRLAAPFLMAGLLFNVGMGLTSRLVPHLQLHFAVQPGQILGGLALLGVLAAMLLRVWSDAAHDLYAALPGL